MKSDELQLWNKIARFEFDERTTKFTFAKRLAKENRWTLELADRVIEEYRKFIFLCCVSKQQMSPSHLVDLAWHLHLTYTRSYWIDLCKNRLDRDLHHNPTQGGEAEDRKFKGLYRDTLTLYKQYFQAVPPSDIWPIENHDPGKILAELDKSRHWVIPKPHFNLQRPRTTLALVLIILSVLSISCVGAFPLVLGIALVIGIVIWLVKRSNRNGGLGRPGCGRDSLDIYDSDDNSEDHVNTDSSDAGGSSDSGGDSGCSSCGGGGD